MDAARTVSDAAPAPSWIGALRRFARVEAPSVQACCEVCGETIPAAHAHLLEHATGKLVCACVSCASSGAASRGPAYRPIPRKVRELDDFQMSDAQWDALMIPIGLAFLFMRTSDERIVAIYPGPAGAIESLLDAAAWQPLVSANTGLATLQPDVEALLVYRVAGARRYYRASIDHCYALVGLLRREWRGFSGGAAVWESIEQFFARLSVGGDEAAAPACAADAHA